MEAMEQFALRGNFMSPWTSKLPSSANCAALHAQKNAYPNKCLYAMQQQSSVELAMSNAAR
jgi:hypothetical protein